MLKSFYGVATATAIALLCATSVEARPVAPEATKAKQTIAPTQPQIFWLVLGVGY